MSGHLFVVHGDLTQLCCDAWLLPCDVRARPNPSWLKSFGDVQEAALWVSPAPEWVKEEQRAMKVLEWGEKLPRPWLVNVGMSDDKDEAWLVVGAEQFVRSATRDLREHQKSPRNERAKYLLALPVVGTGGGGAHGSTGHVVRELVPMLQRLSRELDVDIALVSNDASTFAAAQAQRRTERAAWPELDDHLWNRGEHLAQLAAAGELVLFIGAGVSMNAGLPDWRGLLRDLATDADMTTAEKDTLGHLDVLDQARVIELRMERRQPASATAHLLRQKIADNFKNVFGYTMAHALLAGLPVREVVTTNYDTLFERASKATGKDVSVLPHEPRTASSRWVLKMHGCATDPDSIVLTREDYIRYDFRRQALAGIVQALLLTRHMLFIGFSLRDDNFHRIVDAVRRARPPARSASPVDPAASVDRFGTALSLFSTPLEHDLWANDLKWEPMEEAAPPTDKDDKARARKWAVAARRLEIFLDSVLARTGTTSYLLNPRYKGALTEPEGKLSAMLQRFVDDVERDPAAKAAPAWKHLEALLHRLGVSTP